MKREVTLNSFHIYCGNHQRTGHAEDYFIMIQEWIKKCGYQYSVSNKLVPDKVNLILENFSNYLSNQEITEFKRLYPYAPCVLVLTEFVDRQCYITSMNHFGGLVDSAHISWINLLIAFKRPELTSLKYSDWVRAVSMAPILGLSIFARFMKYLALQLVNATSARQWRKELVAHIYSLAFFHVRYLGLMKYLPLMDLLVSGHREIIPSMVRWNLLREDDSRIGGVVYPLFNESSVLQSILHEKKLRFSISGTISGYRQKWVARFNRMILINGLKSKFGMVEILAHRHKQQPCDCAFALCPAKTANWPYSSPTRIFRSLAIDGCVPVTTIQFHQHPIEELCLQFEGIDSLRTMLYFYENPQSLRDNYAPKLAHYNQLALARNTALMKWLLSILSKSEIT